MQWIGINSNCSWTSTGTCLKLQENGIKVDWNYWKHRKSYELTEWDENITSEKLIKPPNMRNLNKRSKKHHHGHKQRPVNPKQEPTNKNAVTVPSRNRNKLIPRLDSVTKTNRTMLSCTPRRYETSRS